MTNALNKIIQKIKSEEGELRRRGVVYLAVFGSIARGEESPESDIDIAVDIEPGRSFSLIRMEDTRLLLQDRLGMPVDLGEIECFRPKVRAAFDREHISVF